MRPGMARSFFLPLSLVCLLTGVPLQAQPEVSVTYVGHATVLVEGKAVRVLTDPCWREKILGGMKRRIPVSMAVEEVPPLDLVLVSHTHPDHYDADAITRLPGKPTVVMPWGRGKELRQKGMTVIEMSPGETKEIKGVRVQTIRARHMFGHCLGYLFDVDGGRFYFTGDTDLTPAQEELAHDGVDVMLLPYGGAPVFGSIWTTPRAVKAAQQVSPRFVIPIHWGTFARWWTNKEPASPEDFLNKIAEAAPAITGVFLQVGESFALPKRPSKEDSLSFPAFGNDQEAP